MSQMRRQYPFHLIEPQWQNRWEAQETFRAFNPGQRRRPSIPLPGVMARRRRRASRNTTSSTCFRTLGRRLHVGHPEGYTATDILARFERMRGKHVLHPMGWDAFGLPAEQYAIKTGQHPRQTTEENVANFKRQIKSLGFSYDWSGRQHYRAGVFQVEPMDFLQLYNSWFNPATNKAESIDTLKYPSDVVSDEAKRAYRDEHRLAFVSHAPVNWCPELGTVLANEEVIDGKSEVGGHPVVRKPMRQWMLRITVFAQRLLDDLETIDWSDSLKEMQRNWIGRSEGAEVTFTVQESDGEIVVFTTRPDTLFGATYMVLSPEHELVDALTTEAQREAVRAYREAAARKSDLERTELAKDKSGVFTGAYAINPVNEELVPIWIADYVLSSYGTGAIMAVPHMMSAIWSLRRNLNCPCAWWWRRRKGNRWIHRQRKSVESGFSMACRRRKRKTKITDWLQENGKVSARSISAARLAVQSAALLGRTIPDRLARWPARGDCRERTACCCRRSWMTTSPPPRAIRRWRARADWVNLPDGAAARPTPCPNGRAVAGITCVSRRAERRALCRRAAEKYWMNVDLYVGGTEHAVLHLLYARFWHKVLFDLGHVSTPNRSSGW